MPRLEGSESARSILGWCGTLVTKYDVYQLPIPIKESYYRFVSKRLQSIAWDVAKSIVAQGLYLHAVSDCRTIVMDSPYAQDLYLQLLVQRRTDKLTIDEANYWEAKFAERLVFNLMAYVGRQLPVARFNKEAYLRKEWELVKQGLVTPAEFEGLRKRQTPKEVPIMVEHKWKIVNKGKS